MDSENISRAELALPNLQGPPGAPEIELLEVSPLDGALLAKSASPPAPQTWLTFFEKELEFLGVTQILIGLMCLCFGTVVCSVFDISDFDEDIFSSFKVGYPFWGAIFFAVSGFLSIISERKNAMYLEIVSVMLLLTMLGFCSAVTLMVYRLGEEYKRNKVPDDHLYEELNIYSPIYKSWKTREK